MARNVLEVTRLDVVEILKVTLSTIFVMIFLLRVLGCNGNSGMEPQPRPEGWVFMGLADKEVRRVRLFGDYLYACAARDGLYRINVQQSGAEWEFLGLADSTLEHRFNDGVMDVAVLADTILVGYRSGRSNEPGIFRAIEGEFDWQPSDSGMAFSEQIPFANVVRVLSQSPWDPRTIFAGTTFRIVYKSSDFGLTWRPVIGSLPAGLRIQVIRFHPIHRNEIWAGGMGNDVAALWRSTDSGENWQDMKQIVDTIHFELFPRSDLPQVLHEIAFDPANEMVMYLGMHWLWKTADGGNTWTAALDTINAYQSIAINPTNSDEIFVSASFSIYKSIDAAISWKTIDMPIPNSGPSYLAMDWQKRILYTSVFNRPLEIDKMPGVYKMYF